jgi:hypothetical protein
MYFRSVKKKHRNAVGETHTRNFLYPVAIAGKHIFLLKVPCVTFVGMTAHILKSYPNLRKKNNLTTKALTFTT